MFLYFRCGVVGKVLPFIGAVGVGCLLGSVDEVAFCACAEVVALVADVADVVTDFTLVGAKTRAGD